MSKKLATTTIAEVPATDFAYIARPSDFLAMRIIRLHESQSVPMDPAPISSLEFGRQDRATKYAIDASRILFNTWMGGENLLMHYYAPFTPLGPSNQMNWLLTNAYSVYLFGTLAQAGDYVYDQSKLGEWTQKFNDAIVSIKAADQRDRLGPRARVQPSVDTEIA
ncbi:MAG: hypothetical protein R3330_12490 [Saprospiraceae bacterium]|nr:hypothetical protein [Saprospiraceae bacterium]